MSTRYRCARCCKTFSVTGRQSGKIARCRICKDTTFVRRLRPARTRSHPVVLAAVVLMVSVTVGVAIYLVDSRPKQSPTPTLISAKGLAQDVVFTDLSSIAATSAAPSALTVAADAELPPIEAEPTAPLALSVAADPNKQPMASSPPPPKLAVAVAPAIVVVPRRPPPLAPANFKRIDIWSEGALREQLRAVREIALDHVSDTSDRFLTVARATADGSYPGSAALLADRPAFSGLPFLSGNFSRLAREQAQILEDLSTALHRHLDASETGEGKDRHVNATRLRQLLWEMRPNHGSWDDVGALPTLCQVLQVEDEPVRMVMVELLAEMDDSEATAALAVRALVDLSPEVRQAAVGALSQRPVASYRDMLLSGFRYPWPPVAVHAAEALAALQDRGAVPALMALLEERSPCAPRPVPGSSPPTAMLREMVRVNHLSNCLLCHPPSFKPKDLVRATIPRAQISGFALGYGIGHPEDNFIRADITFLRQDFSVRQPVAKPIAGRPDVQRYDYIVRTREMNEADRMQYQLKKESLSRDYQAAVRFALKELTDVDMRPSSADDAVVLVAMQSTIRGSPPAGNRNSIHTGTQNRQASGVQAKPIGGGARSAPPPRQSSAATSR